MFDIPDETLRALLILSGRMGPVIRYSAAVLRFCFTHFLAFSVVPGLLLLARRWILLGGKAWR
jgi:hypothetical protein